MSGGQLRIVGTSTRTRHGYQRNAVEARLAAMRADGRPLDRGRAATLRDLADTIDRERARLADQPEVSGGTHGRLLAQLAALWDAWDPIRGEDASRDPWDDLAAHLQAALRDTPHT